MQEKQDSLTVTVKGGPHSEFPDNESFTTEPPPAYRQPRSAAVQVAKIVAVTVVVASAILGACILASAWIQARSTCELMIMEHQLQEAEMRAAEDRPSFQALVQESNTSTEDAVAPSSTTPATPLSQSNTHAQSDEDTASQENDVHHIKLPLQIDFDDLAGSLMERNQRAHMNCVVEKRRSEELVDHAPRSVNLPFGLNLTTPPRLEHLTGERMVISCESGQDQQKQMPMPPTPIMVPLPGHAMHAIPLPFHPVQHHQQQHSQQGPEVAMIVEQRSGPAAPPVPLSAMVPPPVQPHPIHIAMAIQQQHEQEARNNFQQEGRNFHPEGRAFQPEGRNFHPEGRAFQPEGRNFQPEGRAFQGIPIPIHVQEMPDSNDQQRDESMQHHAEARIFPAGLVQIRQINVHEPAPQSMRPHYVQPRSVPSNPDFLQGNKRVKRCACNCDC